MNRLIPIIVLLSIGQAGFPQHSYRATYSSKAPATLDIQIEFDSTSDEEKDTAGIGEFVQNWLGTTIETSIVLTTKSETSDIELIPVRKVQSAGVVYSGAKYKWENGKLFLFKPGLGKFVPSEKKPVHLKFTGASRKIVGYNCREAKSDGNDSSQVTVWICEELPSSINPAIVIEGVKGAVFEYFAKGGEEIIIKKLEVL
jgi:hypothetical protein